MTWLRWRIFKLLSWIGWRVGPEPHRSRLHQSMTYDKEMWRR